jgi:hypothetical protein
LFQALVKLVVTDIILKLDQLLAYHAQIITLHVLVKVVNKLAQPHHVLLIKNFFQALVKLVVTDIILKLDQLLAYHAQIITLHVLVKVVHKLA